MTDVGALGIRWFRLGSADAGRRPARTQGLALRVVCPHCTNVDTLSQHCANASCSWVSCTCGALVYTRRRHRHPRHGSGRDTCHDPAAAV